MSTHSSSSMPTKFSRAPQEPHKSVGEYSLPWDAPSHDTAADFRQVKQSLFAQYRLGFPMGVSKLHTTDSVAIISGGLDSTTMVYEMLDRGYYPHLLTFNYGQRHYKEITYARMAARTLNLPHDVIDLRDITHLISNSALTSSRSTPGNPEHMYDSRGHKIGQHKDIQVPEGHYAEETMKATVVPNRNMIMLSIAAGIAVNEKARTIGFGVHAGDHFIYPIA